MGAGGAGWVGCEGGGATSSSERNGATSSGANGGFGRKRGGGGAGGTQETRLVKVAVAMMDVRLSIGIIGTVMVSIGRCNQMLGKDRELANLRETITFFKNMKSVGVHPTEQEMIDFRHDSRWE